MMIFPGMGQLSLNKKLSGASWAVAEFTLLCVFVGAFASPPELQRYITADYAALPFEPLEVSVFQVISCSGDSALTVNNTNPSCLNVTVCPTDDIVTVNASSTAYFVLPTTYSKFCFNCGLSFQCVSATAGASQVVEQCYALSNSGPILQDPPSEIPIRISRSTAVGIRVYKLEFIASTYSVPGLDITVEVSNLTADVPFYIDTGPNGNEFHLAVSRPLQVGLYDVLITALDRNNYYNNYYTTWYKISIEVMEGNCTGVYCNSYQRLNPNTCACECPNYCNGSLQLNPYTCQCECPYLRTERDWIRRARDCARSYYGSTFNPVTCGCECVKLYNCNYNQYYDSSSCSCQCTNYYSCSEGMYFDTSTCRCECSNKYCPPGFLPNSDTCECECNNYCSYDEILDKFTCQCRRKSQYPAVQCSSLQTLYACLNAESLFGISCLWQNEACITECCSPKPSRSPHYGFKLCPQLDYYHCSQSGYCNYVC